MCSITYNLSKKNSMVAFLSALTAEICIFVTVVSNYTIWNNVKLPSTTQLLCFSELVVGNQQFEELNAEQPKTVKALDLFNASSILRAAP